MRNSWGDKINTHTHTHCRNSVLLIGDKL